MSNIGPQLPPHLQHLLGSSSKDEESDEESSVGPAAPVAGPQLPPGFSTTTTTVVDDDNEVGPGPSIGPSIPAHLLAPQKRSSTPPSPPRARRQPEAGPSTGQRVVGPALPNYGPTYNPQTYGNIEEDSDSDDDVGPKPLPAGMQHQETNAVQEFLEREERMRKAREVRLFTTFLAT